MIEFTKNKKDIPEGKLYSELTIFGWDKKKKCSIEYVYIVMLGDLLLYSRKTYTDSIIFYVEIITQVKKQKKSKPKIDVFSIFVKELNDKTPVKQNSGKGIVKDSTVARIQDIYIVGIRKDDV